MKSRRQRINNKINNRTSVSPGNSKQTTNWSPGIKGRGAGQETENRKNMHIFEEIAKFFSCLMNTINAQVQESQQTPSRKSIKRNHI